MTIGLSTKHEIQEWLTSGTVEARTEILAALLQLEKAAKKDSQRAQVRDLIGPWRLRFVGPKKSPNTAKANLSRGGKILPSWLRITLAYQTADDPADLDKDANISIGQIMNQVQLGSVKLQLSGPWMYDSKSGIMAFDFLYLKLSILGRSLLSIPVRGGKESEDKFWTQPLKEKAFFRYFWVTPDAIAARGKGGGIALWTRAEVN